MRGLPEGVAVNGLWSILGLAAFVAVTALVVGAAIWYAEKDDEEEDQR